MFIQYKKSRVIDMKVKTQNVTVLEVAQLLRGVQYASMCCTVLTVWYPGAFLKFVLHSLHISPCLCE
jgi:hypothetical protein